MKFTSVIQTYKGVFSMKNILNNTIILHTASHKKNSNTLRPIGGGYLKRILLNLHCTKCNEINTCL